MKKIRHQIFYSFLRVILAPYFAIIGKYHWKVYRPKSKNYVVLTNHNTNWDFFYFGLALPKMMYYVASEHIFRLGFTSKVIVHLVDPIARRKGNNADDTVAEIIRRLQRGDNVCMMAEGNRSFSGETEFISPATAKLVKDSGAGLITFTIHGGYFLNPRWSTKSRKGPVYGQVVHEYLAEDIAKMSLEEVEQIIRRDLYVNAYDDPITEGAKYKGKNLAENLETALFACPKCHSIGTMKSEGNHLFCEECGLRAEYTEKGCLEGNVLPYHSVLDWYRWQKDFLKKFVAEGKEELFSDNPIQLTAISQAHENTVIAKGKMTLFKDVLQVEEERFQVADIAKISVALRGTVLFTLKNGQYYEIKSEVPYSALKYMMAIYQLNGRDYQ